MSQNAIEVNDVSMKFNLSREKVDSLKDYIFKAIKGELQYNEFWALRDINFSVKKETGGESWALIELETVSFLR